MNVSDATAIVTALVAVLGLALSIYNFYVRRRDRKPKLIVRISNGLLTYDRDISDVMLLLEVANTGEKKVTVPGVKIVWNKHTVIFPTGIEGTRKLPFELQPGENANFWTPLREFAFMMRKKGASGKVKIKACFTDAVGSKYYSKGFVVDVNEWT